MKIKSWKWKNAISFGGVEYEINLNPDKGELILLSGVNGSGKSTIFSALDIATYGTTLNKRGTKLSKGNFPNRHNGNMEVNVVVENNNGTVLDITRSMKSAKSPLKTTLIENDKPLSPAKIDNYIQSELGMDFASFKSFCSINVSYFKNFISLTPEDKRMILDKIFNMQQINELNKILRELKKNNSREEHSISNQIKIYKEQIDDLNDSIDEFLNNDDNEQIDEDKVNKKIKKLETSYTKIEELKPELAESIEKFKKNINELKLKRQNYRRDIQDIQNKIDLYNLGKCPTCNHDLTTELDLLPGLNKQIEKTEEVINELNEQIKETDEEIKIHNSDITLINEKLGVINKKLNENKSKLQVAKALEKQKDNIEVFEKNVKSLEEKLEESENEYIEIQKMEYIYNTLNPIWTDNGIKKRIIDSIIDPINAFIAEDLEKINMPFKVELDDKFDAHVYELMNEIDVDSLSSGETRKINLIIMLAYIKMMRMQTNINLLILDEVFTTIDLGGIDDILYLLKDFAEERIISIFVVHHTQLKEYFFNKIMTVDKPYFSVLEIIKE